MQDTKKTYFISGGGTGGHIYPAIAVANALILDGNKVFFVGNKKNLEFSVCKENNLNFLHVDVNYMPRKIGLHFLFWAAKTFFASLIAMFYVLKYRPCAVFATGGYVSAPILIAATILRLPFMTHDCDARPGIVSRVFSKYSCATSIAFDEARKYLKAKNVYFFGNPVRKCFFETDKNNAREKMNLKNLPTLLIMGGSQGAATLNEAACALISHFALNENIQIILQTGKKNYDETLKHLGKLPSNTIVAPYFSDMSIPLAAADLVVSRAGSLSISEICAVGLPSILVPYPYAAADHQRLNAKIMENLGASIYIEDAKCRGAELIKIVNDVLFNHSKIQIMKDAARAQSKVGALENIVDKIKEIAK